MTIATNPPQIAQPQVLSKLAQSRMLQEQEQVVLFLVGLLSHLLAQPHKLLRLAHLMVHITEFTLFMPHSLQTMDQTQLTLLSHSL